MRPRSLVTSVALIGSAAAAYTLGGRRWQLRWGATDQEVDQALPGDGLIARANLTATRAITVLTSPDRVWPWIAQLGQGRGGFYSYDYLENLVGCKIHSADRVIPGWQHPEVGDEVKLHPEVALDVTVLEPGRSLVLHGGVPMGRTPPPYDFTWAFVLREESDEATRLVVRERYGYTRSWAPVLVELVEILSFTMTQKMLRGIRDRAERTAADPGGVTP